MCWESDLNRFSLLLDNRKIFTCDKSKVKTAANRSGNTLARALLASTATTSLGLTPSGKPRRRIEDTQDSGDDSSDTSFKPSKSDSEELEFMDSCKQSSKAPLPSHEIIEISSGSSCQDAKLPAPIQPEKAVHKKSHKHAKLPSPQEAPTKKPRKMTAIPELPLPIKKEQKVQPKHKKQVERALYSSSSESSFSSSSDSDYSEQVFLCPPPPPLCFYTIIMG